MNNHNLSFEQIIESISFDDRIKSYQECPNLREKNEQHISPNLQRFLFVFLRKSNT